MISSFLVYTYTADCRYKSPAGQIQTLDFTEQMYSEGVIPVVFLNTLEK